MKLPFPLQESEQMLALTRRHWLFLYPRLAVLVVVMVAPVAALWTGLTIADALDGVARNVALVASAIWVLYWAYARISSSIATTTTSGWSPASGSSTASAATRSACT